MQETDIIKRIITLCEARSWTVYRLAKESGITYSTLCTMLHKSNTPSIPTLLKICKGLGITLSDFFNEDNDAEILSDSQIDILRKWEELSPENQIAATKFLDYLISEQ